MSGDLEGIAFLLDTSLDNLDKENDKVLTPLNLTIVKGQIDAANILLVHGAQADRVSVENSLRPLHYSIMGESMATTKLLLDAGADANGQISDGYSPLHLSATINDNQYITNALVEGGVTIALRVLDKSPLSMAMSRGHVNICNTLPIAGSSFTNVDLLLHGAPRYSLVDVLRIILDEAAAIDERDGFLATPLIISLVFDKPDVFELLCKRGADISIVREFQFF